MNKQIKVVIITLTVVHILIIAGIIIGVMLVKKGDNDMEIIEGGVVKDNRLPGYNEKIKSKDITFFEYICGEYRVSCELKDNELNVKSKGGYSNSRDGKYFKLDYTSKDKSILKELQDIIDKYNLSKDNGYEHEVAGLPDGLGGTLSVIYKSGEKIWRYDNQSNIISEEVEQAIYDLFHRCAKDNGFDFNSDSSNVELYNDADKEYLQGTWNGKHFGSEYKVIFTGEKVKIYKDGKLTDDVYYKIIDGDVVNNKPKKGVTIPRDKNDFEEFSDISTFRKKNDFTMTMYFMKNSYSTDDLLKEE